MTGSHCAICTSTDFGTQGFWGPLSMATEGQLQYTEVLLQLGLFLLASYRDSKIFLKSSGS